MGQLLPARTSQEERDWLEVLGIAAPPFTAGFLVAGAGIDAVKQAFVLFCILKPLCPMCISSTGSSVGLHTNLSIARSWRVEFQLPGIDPGCGIRADYLHSETEVMEPLVAPVPVGSGALSQCQELFPVPLQEPQLRSGCAESMEVRLINPGRGRACLAGNSSGPLLMTPAWKSGSAGTAGVSLAVWCHQVCPCCGQIRGGY